jgi:hypothetical protein
VRKGFGGKNEERAFKKGRPRFVVFIMCEEEAWGEVSSCIMKMDDERERKEKERRWRRGGERGAV